MPLHERAHGLATVRTSLARVQAGATVLVAVTGAPGMGRSAFLDAVGELAARDGFAVRRAAGSRLEQALRLGVTGQLLAQADVDAVARAADVAPAMHAIRAVHATVATERAHAAAPVAFLVDDMQWADEASLDWLARLAADPRPAPLLMVVAVCEGESAAELPGVQDLLLAAHQVVRIMPLDTEGVRALLRERGVHVADAPLLAWWRATGGNPALLTSLLSRLENPQRTAAGRLLAAARARPAPWSLRCRVAAALISHPESVRRLAGAAVILDGAAEAHTLARLARLDPAEESSAARALHRLGWFADRCEPPVLWDCVREINEDGLALTDRTALHRRAAELLNAAGAPVERIIPHLLEIGPGGWRGAAWLLREAADDARRRGDVDVAIRCLRRALREFPPASPQRGEFLAALAETERDVDSHAALRHVTQAIPLLGSVCERAAVVANVPLTLFVSAGTAASEMIESARTFAAAQPSEPEAAEQGMRLEARVRLFELGDQRALADAVTRLRAWDPGPAPGSAGQRELVSVLAFAGTLGGGLSAAEIAALVRWMLEHEPASAASGHAASALMIASGIAAEVVEPVLSWLDMAFEAAQQRADDLQRTRILGWRAMAALQAGRLADAWADARDACAAGPGPLRGNDWLSVLGLVSVAVETRDLWLAERLRVVLSERQEIGMQVRGLALQVLQALLTPEPDMPAVAADLLAAVRRAEAAGWTNQTLFPIDLWCVPLLLRHGETETALQLLAHACDRARAFGSPTALGRDLRIWGTVVRGRYALSLLAESVAVLREGPNSLELGRALTAYATRLRAAGRPGSGELLAEADRIADRTGASLLHCWTVPSDGELHGVVPPGSEGLSDTERRVAALVALGHTNQDAAAALGVSRRAVEKTLTRLYRRLDVEGRAGLIPVIFRRAGRAAFLSGTLSEKLWPTQDCA